MLNNQRVSCSSQSSFPIAMIVLAHFSTKTWHLTDMLGQLRSRMRWGSVSMLGASLRTSIEGVQHQFYGTEEKHMNFARSRQSDTSITSRMAMPGVTTCQGTMCHILYPPAIKCGNRNSMNIPHKWRFLKGTSSINDGFSHAMFDFLRFCQAWIHRPQRAAFNFWWGPFRYYNYWWSTHPNS